ncbi:MAG: patatin-like phospholipase family protein, partial [Proteobacteria bacterium]|nr:patatin-like phospholipase family protein [Pseudomonadota bacterium]
MHRILSIDGGGARGLIPARILAYLEERLVEETGNEDLRICDVFDFIAGTSVGGVLALIYLTPSGNGPLPYTAREVWQQLARMLPGVFSVGIWKKINTAWGLGGVKYDDRRLDTWLRFFCSQTMLSQIDKPCLITAYDFRAQSPVYFRSHMARQNPSDNFSLFDVGRSTCAAPSYFAPHEFTDAQEKRSYFCSDGILFAYNPALAAYAEVRKMSRQHNAAHMYIVSLGTGESPDAHDPAEINDWGGLQWGVVIGKLMADCTSRNVDEQLRQVFRDSLQNYVRLNPDLAPDCSADMDCVRPDNLQALVACAENYIENNREKLEEVVAVLSRTYIESRTPSAAPPLPLQHAGTDYAALWQQSIPAYHAGVNAPGQNALAFENDRFALSYARLNDCLNHLRTGLSMRLYTRRGSRAIIAVQDGLSAHVIARALIILGASFCLYREKLSPSQLARALVRGGQVLFIDEAQLNAFAAADFTKLSVVSVGADDFAGTARIHQRIGTAVSQLLHRLQVAIGAAASAKAPGSVIGLRQLLSVASKKQPAASGPEAADCAWMNEDDGRAWSQRNLVVSAAQLYSLISRFAVPAEHSPVIILGVHPCSHTAVTVAQVLAPRLGARVIFAPHPISMYSASRVWNDADRLYIFASPQWFVKLIDDGPARASLGRIRFAAVVGSGLPPSLARQWSKLSSAPLVLAWTQAAGEAVLGWADAQDAQTIAPLEAVEFYSIRNKPPQQDEAEGTAPRATEAGA